MPDAAAKRLQVAEHGIKSRDEAIQAQAATIEHLAKRLEVAQLQAAQGNGWQGILRPDATLTPRVAELLRKHGAVLGAVTDAAEKADADEAGDRTRPSSRIAKDPDLNSDDLTFLA